MKLDQVSRGPGFRRRHRRPRGQMCMRVLLLVQLCCFWISLVFPPLALAQTGSSDYIKQPFVNEIQGKTFLAKVSCLLFAHTG